MERLFLIILAIAVFWQQPAHARAMGEYTTAVLRMLDKVTARVEVREVKLNDPVLFGTLQVTVRACRQTPPEEMPESAAYIEISEFKPGEIGKAWFQGWMFASNPALSALEHPVYDIWLTSCKNDKAMPSSEEESPSTEN